PIPSGRTVVALCLDSVTVHVGQLCNARKPFGRTCAQIAQNAHQAIALRNSLSFPPGVRQLVYGRLVLDAADHDQLSIAEPVAATHRLVERSDFEPQAPEIRNCRLLERLSKKKLFEPLPRIVRVRHLRKPEVFPHLRARRDRPLHSERGLRPRCRGTSAPVRSAPSPPGVTASAGSCASGGTAPGCPDAGRATRRAKTGHAPARDPDSRSSVAPPR